MTQALTNPVSAREPDLASSVARAALCDDDAIVTDLLDKTASTRFVAAFVESDESDESVWDKLENRPAQDA
ncbi:MAG: hypothetical protein JRG92_24270 [Deltaproteobacteria bacterium]|nr:hypothetical protein [Deltaproteobacteria bacterium]MBW2386758.1 hypothetical protein [Deltaproteobacteria bacterium]MBW2695442.1 hypothetical protein [Deltaproteobacteria bacterium]